MSWVGVILETKSLSDAVYAALREWIVTGGARTDSLVTEVGVAAEYRVARPTARVALERLLSDGLLVRDGRRGARVRVLDATDVSDLYAARLLLEAHAHRRLAERALVPVQASTANLTLRMLATRQDTAGVVAADVAFHRALVSAAGSSRVDRMHELLMGESHLCMGQVQRERLLPAETIAAEHDDILAAIDGQHEENVAVLTEAHLVAARDKLLAVIGGSGSSAAV